MARACLCVSVHGLADIRRVHTTGCPVSSCLIKREERPFKLLPNSGSFTERRPCELRVKWRKLPCLAASSEATYRSSSCSQKVVQVKPVFEHPAVPAFYGLTESFQEHQAGCPTFFSRNHTDSVISAQLSSPHSRLYKQSGQSHPLMFINWVYSLDLSVTPFWVKSVPLAAEEHQAVMKLSKRQHGLVLLIQRCSQKRFIFSCVISHKHCTTTSTQTLPAAHIILRSLNKSLSH